MKKIVKIIMTGLMFLCFTNTVVFADAAKGQKIYIRSLKAACGMDGGTMAKQYTQAQWKSIYESGKLNEEFAKKCSDVKPLKDNHLQDVYDFLYNYAKDSGNVPAC